MKLSTIIEVLVVTGTLVICDNPASTVYQISMQRIETKAEKLVRLGKFDELENIRQLATVGQFNLTDFFDTQYGCVITVGTPAMVTIYTYISLVFEIASSVLFLFQAYPVIIDTGSSDLFLASTLCTDCSWFHCFR